MTWGKAFVESGIPVWAVESGGLFVKLRLQVFERLGGVYICQFPLRDLDRYEAVGMAANDTVAAVILGQREQLAVKLTRENAGVAALAVVCRADNILRVLPPAGDNALDGAAVQKRLVGDHI